MPMEVLAPGSGHADPPLGPHEQKFSGPRVWSGGDTKLFIHSSFSLFKWMLLPKLPGRALNVLAVRLTLHHPWGGTPIFFIIFHLVGSISTCADGGPRSQSVHAWVLGYKKVSWKMLETIWDLMSAADQKLQTKSSWNWGILITGSQPPPALTLAYLINNSKTHAVQP